MESRSAPRLIPKCRRRYHGGSLSSSPVAISGSCPIESGMSHDQESVKGNAYLCFWEDGSRFEGHLTTDNESHYSLVGRCPDIINSKIDVNGGDFSSNYDVTLVDLDDEETYYFHRVSLVENKPLRSLLSPKMTFKAKDIYKGQKADMLIQRYLTPRLVGQNLMVFAGPLAVDLDRSTSQPSSWKSSPLWYL